MNGQHRNRALAVARRAKAVELRTTGLTCDQIAMELGYANRGTVFHVISEALKAQTAEAVGELRSLEVERLDSLQLAVWQKAMDGDVPSAIAVVHCITARCHLLGLPVTRHDVSHKTSGSYAGPEGSNVRREWEQPSG